MLVRYEILLVRYEIVCSYEILLDKEHEADKETFENGDLAPNVGAVSMHRVNIPVVVVK